MACWTEWDPLEEVIVGDCFLWEDIKWHLPESTASKFAIILEETKEDLDKFAVYLAKMGIKVHRPIPKINEELISIAGFDIKHATAPIVPRDQYMVYGENIYQTYTTMPDRYLDSLSYYHIFLELFKQGHNWISQPPPELKNFDKNEDDFWWTNGEYIYTERYKDKILWHTATMKKYGDTLLSNWGPGTKLGELWMQRNLPEGTGIQRSTTGDNNSSFGHIDHGFFNISDDIIVCAQDYWIPNCLKNKKIYNVGKLGVDEIKLTNFTKPKLSDEYLDLWISEWKGYIQEVCFDCNPLVIDSHNVVFNNHQPKVFKLLESIGINCHVINIRHGFFWEAGIHCLTLDIKRRGNKRKIINV